MMIPVIDGQPLHSGVRLLTGSIPVRALAAFFTVPYRNAMTKEGYQRRPQDVRINRFVSELRKGETDVPTSILLNIRNDAVKYLTTDDDGRLVLEFSDSQDPPELFVVDGQHRVLAFKKLFDEDPQRWGDHKLQFVLMLGASKREEMNQFYVVNTTAKSVKTDLALDLLKQRAEADGKVMDGLVAQGTDWKVTAQEIVDELFHDSSVWKGRIQLANEPKGQTIIPSTSFVVSLKSLLTNSAIFQSLAVNKQVQIIDAYWSGIRSALRDPFDGKSTDYALQKGVGVTAMHEILPTVIEILRSRGDSVFDVDAYVDVMTRVLQDLSGDNVNGDNVSGAEFWLTAPKGGAAGSFSSSAGKRVLFAKLRGLLPPMEVE